jgi:iron complex transport system substrate-binding protein
MWYNEKLDPSDVMSGEGDFEAWKDLTAVKNKRVYEDSDPFIFDFHSPRLPLALIAMAKNLYPDKYADVDLNQTVDSFMSDMFHVHYPGYAPA